MAKQKLRKFAEIGELSFVLQYPYHVLQQKGFPYKGGWAKHLFHNENPLTLELGCGGGEYTVDLARRFANRNYIGIDRKGARMWTGAMKVADEKLSNVYFLRTDIDLINHFFAPNEVDEIWITFPDPMMKKSRRRLLSSVYFEKYRQMLAPSGVIHLKTDSPFLFQYTLWLLEANHIEPLCYTDDLYGEKSAELLQSLPNVRTRYEEQWITRGKSIKYLRFMLPLHADAFVEPDEEPPFDDYHSLMPGSEKLKKELESRI